MKHQKHHGSTLGVLTGIWFFFLLTGLIQAQITTRSDSVGKLLNQWHSDGTAGGLGAFMYENRDGGHSMLNLGTYPQLQLRKPTADEKASKSDVGPANTVRQLPVFGNCSMAAPANNGGSLPRFYLLGQSGFDFLNNQYLHNNLFFYPEHQDYDQGCNGQNGWGDLYPANTPYIVISQGSSYTDLPFLQAFLSAAAAFSPETQALLIKSNAVMPTLQSIFRKSSRRVKSDEDYLSGKAHPVVFDHTQIDEEKMVALAHAMTHETIPPFVLLDVLKEDRVAADKDFFETTNIKDEKLGTSACAIARVFRGAEQSRKYTLSSKRSVDFMKRPLTMKWVLLQGDPNLIKIEPSDDGMEATVTVAWHPEFYAPSGIISHRVDIGVFGNNGITWSAPALFSIFMLPNEARFYDATGRLLEICYEAGNTDLGLPATTDLRWLTLGRRLSVQPSPLAIKLLKQNLTAETTSQLIALADEFAPDQNKWRTLSRVADQKSNADALLLKMQNLLRTRLETSSDNKSLWLVKSVTQAISSLADTVELYTENQSDAIELAVTSIKTSAPSDLAQARKRLLDFQVFNQMDNGKVALMHDASQLSPGERYQLRQLNLTLLSQVFLPEFLDRSIAPAFVDSRLTTPKAWRDLYHYDETGKCIGWSRITNGHTYEFDPDGHLLPDGLGGKEIGVSYVLNAVGDSLIFIPK